MKKLLMAISMLSFALPLCGELKRDHATYRYYSLPAAPDINQDEYHILVWQCKDIITQHRAATAGSLGASSWKLRGGGAMVSEYLQRIATPTSLRLLADLQKINFAI